MEFLDNLTSKNFQLGVASNFFEAIEYNDEKFVGFTYELDYNNAKILTNDKWKLNVKGVPHGTFLIAIYNNELSKYSKEGILLRVVDIAKIPQSSMIIEAMIDTYMEQPEARKSLSPDVYTKNYYQFSGLDCRILGTFFFEEEELKFGTDLENFLGAHKYKVFKPSKEQLEKIVNSKNEKDIDEISLEVKIGDLRYSSSKSYTLLSQSDYSVPVVIKANDIVSRRTAFFGMTRTGKSNTIKIVMSAIVALNKKFMEHNNKKQLTIESENYKKAIGQIVFDINGEYTFPNKQDVGSIYDKFSKNDTVIRYSVSPKKVDKYTDVRSLQYNFFDDKMLEETFELLCEQLMFHPQQFISAFKNIKLFDTTNEEDTEKNDAERRFYKTSRLRKIALYKCILYRAGFKINANTNYLFFQGVDGASISENKLSIKNADKWFEDNYVLMQSVQSKSTGLKVWDKDYEALYNMLLANRGGGYKVLIEYSKLHSITGESDYKIEIDKLLRSGKIVLVDLSSASEQIQRTYITRLCSYIFSESMNKFTDDIEPEFIQMYFEEAHNIFPKDDNDLRSIYNRLAKEGAKLKLGISYSTQEVSSISPSILKNTQNWFISHLNNRDELRALEKYYDFGDFSDSIMKNSDVGYARIKTYSNNFIIPVQIKRFEV
ncbi:ATP-binding protein [Aliarcobacter butzleri]|uniref:ATP-binding protein n=1 Tax=Aliarcobacter butzleri TaxID=28197 RepID=UPI003AF62E82